MLEKIFVPQYEECVAAVKTAGELAEALLKIPADYTLSPMDDVLVLSVDNADRVVYCDDHNSADYSSGYFLDTYGDKPEQIPLMRKSHWFYVWDSENGYTYVLGEERARKLFGEKKKELDSTWGTAVVSDGILSPEDCIGSNLWGEGGGDA